MRLPGMGGLPPKPKKPENDNKNVGDFISKKLKIIRSFF